MDNEKIILDLYKRVVDLEEKLNGALKDIETLKYRNENENVSSNEIKINSSKNTTKYLFNGKSYGKSRLVLAVVKFYVYSHPNITFNELVQAFDASLQGSFGVLNKSDILEQKYINNKLEFERRFFKEHIELNDGTKIYVCSQWGIFNINKFIANAENYGYSIKKI